MFKIKITKSLIYIEVTLMLILAMSVSNAAPITQNYTNSSPASVDPNQTSPVNRSITVAGTDFPASATVDNVTLSIDFDKRDRNNGLCSNYNGGLVYNNEIYFELSKSSAGVNSVLIPFNTYSGNTHPASTNNGFITVVLDDDAGTTVGGGTPVGGTFAPINPLSNFDGIDPSGSWMLIMRDSAGQDPLCFFSYTLSIEASAKVDISVTKSDVSANYQPGDTLNYTIIISNAGPGDAIGLLVNDPIVNGAQSTIWNCTAVGGASCGTASGVGAVSNVDVDIPSGDSVQFLVDVTLSNDPSDF